MAFERFPPIIVDSIVSVFFLAFVCTLQSGLSPLHRLMAPLLSIVCHFCLVLIFGDRRFCYELRGISSNGRQRMGKYIAAALWEKPMATEGMRCCGLSISVCVSVGAISMVEKQTRCTFEVVEVRLPPTNRLLFG